MTPPALVRVAEVPSTMEAAHAMAQQGAPHGAAIVAERQSAGRGTRGRKWSAEAGGLWLSVVTRPEPADALEALSLRVGLGIAEMLSREFPLLPRVGLKWPNDLHLDGRKLAGVLCEARWVGQRCQWVVVGVGLNVSNPIPDELAGQVALLRDWLPAATAERLAEPVALAVADAARDAGPLDAAALARFAARDVLQGKTMLSPVAGTAEGITAAGALRIRAADGAVHEVLGGVVPATV